MDHEILVYIQKVKNYLKPNEDARNYFIGESDVDEFYRHLTIISEKNFNQNGQPDWSVLREHAQSRRSGKGHRISSQALLGSAHASSDCGKSGYR